MRPSRCAVLLLLLLLAVPAQAQLDDADFWPGTHFFRHLLSARKLTPLASFQALGNDPAHSILIVLGRHDEPNRPHLLNRIPGGLENFVKQGGAVLIATDHGLTHPALSRLCGYWVSGGKVQGYSRQAGARWEGHDQIVEKRFIFRDQPDCLKVEPMGPFQPPLFLDTPLLLDRRHLRVATNRSTYLAPNFGASGKVLARFPSGCYYSNTPLTTNREPFAFAVAAEPEKGRLLLLADHSVFTNEMILEGEREKDNDNFLFAFNVVEWLRGSEGERTHVLFVEDGYIQTDLRPSLRESDTPLRDLLQGVSGQVNGMIQEMQEEHQRTNVLNRNLINVVSEWPGEQLFNNRGVGNYFRYLLLIAAIGAGLYGMRRITRAAHRYDPGIPLFGAIVGKHRPSGSTLAMRHQEALVEDDLREFARESARDWFESLPGFSEFGEQPPTIESSSRSLRREVLHLWELSQGADCPKMGKLAFKQFLGRLDELRQTIDDGQLRVSFQHDAQAGD